MIREYLSLSLIITSSIDNRVTKICQIKSLSTAIFINSSNLNAISDTCYIRYTQVIYNYPNPIPYRNDMMKMI